MRELATKILKKVSLEIIYDAVEEKTTDIRTDIAELKQKQETDFRYLNQRIDTQIGQVRQEIGQLNQRFDSVLQVLMDINRQLVEISKQKN